MSLHVLAKDYDRLHIDEVFVVRVVDIAQKIAFKPNGVERASAWFVRNLRKTYLLSYRPMCNRGPTMNIPRLISRRLLLLTFCAEGTTGELAISPLDQHRCTCSLRTVKHGQSFKEDATGTMSRTFRGMLLGLVSVKEKKRQKWTRVLFSRMLPSIGPLTIVGSEMLTGKEPQVVDPRRT